MRDAEAARAAELAEESGFLTMTDLVQGGFDRDLARREVKAARWQRPIRGYYVPHAKAIDDKTLARLATSYAGEQSLLTGLIAARAMGMRWIPSLPGGQVLVPAATRRRSTGPIQVRRSAHCGELRGWKWEGVRLAIPGRVVLDSAMALPSLRDVRGVVMGAVADRLATPDELMQLLSHEPRNGTALLRRAIADARDGAASPPEAELVDELRGCGLPFLVNPELRIHGKSLGFTDGYFVGPGAGWEVDSRERHEGDEQFDVTLGRHTAFGGHGLVLAHPTPRRIRTSKAETVEAVLNVARARLLLPPGLREPVGLEVIPRGPVIR